MAVINHHTLSFKPYKKYFLAVKKHRDNVYNYYADVVQLVP